MKICFWDEGAQKQRERDATPAEAAEVEARRNAPPQVPVSVPMRNARFTLISAGKMAAVKAYLAAIPGVTGELARERFEFEENMRRDDPLVVGVPAEIMSDAEKDALFIAAGALNA